MMMMVMAMAMVLMVMVIVMMMMIYIYTYSLNDMQLMESTACANPARTRRDASASPGSAAKAPFPNGVAPSGPEKFTFLRRKLVVYHLTTGDNNGISMGYIYIIIYIYILVGDFNHLEKY